MTLGIEILTFYRRQAYLSESNKSVTYLVKSVSTIQMKNLVLRQFQQILCYLRRL